MKAAAMSLAVAAVAALAAPQAMAVEYQQNASGTCNGALPIFEQSLRFRPLALANTGDSFAFVSCTNEAEYQTEHSIYGARIHNPTSAAVDVSCTLVSGRDSFDKVSIPKTQNFAANGGGFIIWSTADNGGANYFDLVNLSCNLPAGVELEYVARVTVDPAP
jgi:hypothetical protein